MNYKNKDKKSYNLQIFLSRDSSVFNLNYTVDNVNKSVSLSNRGLYSIYLGHFSELDVETNNNVKVSLVERKKSFNRIYKNFKITLEKEVPDAIILRGYPYIFDDLRNNNGNDLYCSFNRILKIAIKYAETKEETLLDDIKYGLKFLMNNWYTGKENYSGNWWFYEIGVPRCLNEILFIIKDDIDNETIYNYLNIERFYLPHAKYMFYRRNYPDIYREHATYANLAENIYICSLRAILQETSHEFEYLFDLIKDTLKTISTGDGFYSDGSFIQHNNVPYNCSYGEVLLNSLAKILTIYNLLGYDCANYLKKLHTILFESYSPFLYDGQAIESVRGRAVSRMSKNARYSFDAIMVSANRLRRIFATAKLKSFVRIEENKSYVKYSKAFNYMDRFIARNGKYLLSINANSDYICNYECINGENLLGDYSSNFTYDLLFNNKPYNKEYPTPFYINPFYRNGSTNTFEREKPNKVYINDITAGVSIDNLLSTCWHQNTDVKGHFSKIILDDSMVAIGTDISSDKEYVSTIYNFDEDYIVDGNVIRIGDIKIVCSTEFNVEKFTESKSPYDLNVNQSKNVVEYSTNRIYMKKPKHYLYQIYPDYNKEKNDEFDLTILNACHIIKYKDYIFINSFDENELNFENINFKGRFCAVLKYESDDEISLHISTGKRIKTNINFAIDGYHRCSSNTRLKTNLISINDELVHKFKFKKKLDK